MSYETDVLTGRGIDPDAILPRELYGPLTAEHDPERRLRLAVLEHAVRCFQQNLDARTRHGRTLYEDAVDWFWSPDRDEPFAFENLCDALGLNPEYVRRGLNRWRDVERAGGHGTVPPRGRHLHRVTHSRAA